PGRRVYLFDYLVGALLQEPRQVQPKRLGGLEVDDQLESRWSLDRQLAWLGALEDSIDVNCRVLVKLSQICAVGHQRARHGERREKGNGRHTKLQRPLDNLRTLSIDERRREEHHTLDGFACGTIKSTLEIFRTLDG